MLLFQATIIKRKQQTTESESIKIIGLACFIWPLLLLRLALLNRLLRALDLW